jgi:hypothetical protein
MTDSKEVPRLVLDGKLLPAPLLTEWRCLECPFVARGMSLQAVQGAMDAHVAYVNTQLDRATDPHFAEIRLDHLIRT